MLKAAEPSDMLIVCSEYSLQIKPESTSVEEEVVLFLDRITNFPGYTTGTEEDTGANLKGPYAGGDIAVYHLTRESLALLKSRMSPGRLWPACLPKKDYTDDRGIFAGWLDQEPFYRRVTDTIQAYEDTYLTLKSVEVIYAIFSFHQFHVVPFQVEQMTCKDPDWMNTSASTSSGQGTFYISPISYCPFSGGAHDLQGP